MPHRKLTGVPKKGMQNRSQIEIFGRTKTTSTDIQETKKLLLLTRILNQLRYTEKNVISVLFYGLCTKIGSWNYYFNYFVICTRRRLTSFVCENEWLSLVRSIPSSHIHSRKLLKSLFNPFCIWVTPWSFFKKTGRIPIKPKKRHKKKNLHSITHCVQKIHAKHEKNPKFRSHSILFLIPMRER